MALSPHPKVWQILSGIFVVLTILFALCYYFSTLFVTFMIGVALIILVQKLKNDYSKRMSKYQLSKARRRLYGGLLAAFWIIVFIVLFSNSVAQMRIAITSLSVDQSVALAYFQQLRAQVPTVFVDWVPWENLVKTAETRFLAMIRTVLSSMSSIVFNGILIIPLMFFTYFKKRKAIMHEVVNSVPKKFHASMHKAMHAMTSELHDFLRAKITERVIVGSLCCFGFFVAGVKGWLLLGILAGFFNLIPYLGPILGAIPALLFAILDGPTVALYVLITLVAAQIVDNFYLLPFMISSKVRMNALLSIVLILVGAKVLGIAGMIFAIPVFIVYKIVLRDTHNALAKIYR
ncbi:MAG: AI-2E family transporter [Candidatus Woesearchaeota archaeon]|jgi:predicted PurR-regulated permease PerM|nr:AI-2E family transporter [Candidatus Woesearchaeota archaeon]